MGSGATKSAEKKGHIPYKEGQKMENNCKAGQREEAETDTRHKGEFKTPPSIHKKDLKDLDHQAKTDGTQALNEATHQNEEKDIQEERLMLAKISRLNVKQQMTNIRACKDDKLNSHKVAQMSKRLQQFCIDNRLAQTDELRLDSQAANTLAERRQEKTRLLHKLSEIAGTRLKHNNPNLADLSDENRPTKLVNRLSELYDNDWTDIFERVREKIGHDVDDKEIICYLKDILKQCYERCRALANTQRQNILKRLTGLSTNEAEPTLLLYITSLQKKSAECSIKFFTTSIKEVLKTSPVGTLLTDKKSADPVYCKYVEGCTDIMWHTQIQNPPIYLDFETTNKDWFKKFTSPGQNIDYIVWPVMLLHENGPLLAKGIAQFSKGKPSGHNKTHEKHLNNDNIEVADPFTEAKQPSISIPCANGLPESVVNENFNHVHEERDRQGDVENMRNKGNQNEPTRTNSSSVQHLNVKGRHGESVENEIINNVHEERHDSVETKTNKEKQSASSRNNPCPVQTDVKRRQMGRKNSNEQTEIRNINESALF